MQGTTTKAVELFEAGDLNPRQWGIHSYLSAFPGGATKKVNVNRIAEIFNTDARTVKGDLVELQEQGILDDKLIGFVTDFPSATSANP